MMINITLKQLRYFDALARELHFGRAAESCSVTQPALSMQIQELEQNLGIALLERTRTGVRLTSQGAEVAKRASLVLGDVRDLIEFARHGEEVLTGGLRLGVIPSVAPYLLPHLLPLLRETYPELELHVRETQTEKLLKELSEGRLDAILLALPIRGTDLEVEELFEDQFLLALPAEREISSKLKANRAMVEEERLLLLEEGHCLRDQALSYCELRQAQSIDTFGASSLGTIVELVAAGYGITLLPEISVHVENRGRNLKLVRFEDPEPSRRLGIAWRATSPRKSDFKKLAELARRAGEKILTEMRGSKPEAA